MNDDAHAQALQDRFSPNGICFGCGPKNAKGLRIKSHVVGADVECEFHPEAHHQAFEGTVNGGIVGALFDCHGNWAACHALMKAKGLDHPPSTVTAEFHVKLKRPTPATRPIRIKARAVEVVGDRAVIEETMESDGVVTATCRAVFVAVEAGHPAYHRWA